MHPAIVIITKNEAHIIGNTLQSLQGLSDEIIIVDNGSTDDTIRICKQFNCRVIETSWQGYGPTKNIGIDAASRDWILSLDADEAIDEILKKEILSLGVEQEQTAYKLNYRNFFGNKWIRYGVWGHDKHTRLFNRKHIRWNDAAVHENLNISNNITIKELNGNVLHYTVGSIRDYSNKTLSYAALNARKYFSQGKKAGFTKLYLSPAFNFIHNYFFRLGFLDGFEGFLICKTTAWYTFMKYAYLRELQHSAIPGNPE